MKKNKQTEVPAERCGHPPEPLLPPASLWCGNLKRRRGNWFVNLVDENDLEGPVVVWNDDGAGGDMTMPQEMFLALRDSGREMPYTGVDVVKLPPTLAHLKP